MKKTIFLLAFSAIATLGFSQSKIFVGGSFSLGTTSGKETFSIGTTNTTAELPSTSNFGIDVHGAYFISDKLAVGLGLGFHSDKTPEEVGSATRPVTETATTSQFIFAPMAYYFLPITDKFVWAPSVATPIGSGGISYESKSGSTTETTKSDLSSFGVVISPLSFDYHITDNIAINFSAGNLSFISEKEKKNDSNSKYEKSNNAFNLSLNPGITFGFRLYF
ncbi:MAG: outer membrane beta-barrel protein [Dysgonamonadaceae bacterium]|jgi:outer membrane protein W|nr:outer membrane beta-barrel protein [Dysgonamonadaceae bacterium]